MSKILDRFFFDAAPFNYIFKSNHLTSDGIELKSITIKCNNDEKLKFHIVPDVESEVIKDIDIIIKNNIQDIVEIKKEHPIEINYIINMYNINRVVDIKDVDFDVYYIFINNIYSIKRIEPIMTEILFKNNERIILNIEVEDLLPVYEKMTLLSDNKIQSDIKKI